MEFTLNFSTRDRMGDALDIIDRNPNYRCICYGRDWSKHNFMIPWAPMFYVTFERVIKEG